MRACALFLGFWLILVRLSAAASSFDSAAKVTNELGIDLFGKNSAGEGNLCLSPYSISCALVMTLAGADGETRTEMSRVLHVDSNVNIDQSFTELQKSLDEMVAKTVELANESKHFGGTVEPITLAIANRLFAEQAYDFRPEFLQRMKEDFAAPLEPVDFRGQSEQATRRINDWVAQQTRDRIRNLIPGGALNTATRLVLANALYLKAPWEAEFKEGATKPEPFYLQGKSPVPVATMTTERKFGYAKRNGFTAVAIPYNGGELQFVVLLPDERNGLSQLEKQLNTQILAECARVQYQEVVLHLPKFKLEPPTIALAAQLQSLGMKTAFDVPRGSANFDGIARRKPNDYLAISDVFHKTFISVDEHGTEAAAATAVAVKSVRAMLPRPTPKPIEVKIDRPFFYAIQHAPSGACLFIGRVTDPR